jgi:hypothetical protein
MLQDKALVSCYLRRVISLKRRSKYLAVPEEWTNEPKCVAALFSARDRVLSKSKSLSAVRPQFSADSVAESALYFT